MTNLPVSDPFARVEPGPRKEHKRLILSCALACFNELGIQATTVETIRERANSSIGSIYHHFGNKDGLIAALFFAALDDQLALTHPRLQAAASAKDAIEVLVQTYLEWVTQQPELARFMSQARASVADGPFGQELLQRNKERYGRMLEWLEKGVNEGSVRVLPRETYASLLIGPSENYCRAWLSGRVKSRPTDFVQVFSEAAWRSVGSCDVKAGKATPP
jgi:AcrR family transcriptional regulator